MIIRRATNGTAPGSRLLFYCVACEELHQIVIGTESGWEWDGNETAPTINPSLRVTGAQWSPEYSFYKKNHTVAAGERTICHSYIQHGVWKYLEDCTHIYAGQDVPMVEIPEG